MLLILLVRGHRRLVADGRGGEVACYDDGCFWLTLGGMTAVILMGCLPTARRTHRHAAGGRWACSRCVELGWYGFSLFQVAPAEQFLGDDPIGTDACSSRSRMRMDQDEFASRHATHSTAIFPAAVLGIEKTNINDVFQLDHAARLYELLYPVASFQRRRRMTRCRRPSRTYSRQVRQAVFDRLSVGYLVSNRFEADPGGPCCARSVRNNRPGSFSAIRRHCRVPTSFPTAIDQRRASTLTLPPVSRSRPAQTVFMNVDPLRHAVRTIPASRSPPRTGLPSIRTTPS